MVATVLEYLRRNAIALTALGCALLALAGAGYAAINLPKGSVGTAQLRNGAVTAKKLNHNVIGGYVAAWANVSSVPRVLSSSGRVKVASTTAGSGQPGFNLWWRTGKFPRHANACSVIAEPSTDAYYDGSGHVTVYYTSGTVGPGVTLSVDLVC